MTLFKGAHHWVETHPVGLNLGPGEVMCHGHGVGTNPPYTPGARNFVAGITSKSPEDEKERHLNHPKFHAFGLKMLVFVGVGFVAPNEATTVWTNKISSPCFCATDTVLWFLDLNSELRTCLFGEFPYKTSTWGSWCLSLIMGVYEKNIHVSWKASQIIPFLQWWWSTSHRKTSSTTQQAT